MNINQSSFIKLREKLINSQVPTYFESYLEERSLVVDELLNIPLFHGTSTLFTSSIKENGLGGYRDENVFDMDLALKLMGKSLMVEDWKEFNNFKESTKSILDRWKSQYQNDSIQQLSNNTYNCNWRYGSVYLTASYRKASHFYTTGYGSEFLNLLDASYNVLLNENVTFLNQNLDSKHPWREIFSNKNKYKPALVVVKPKSIAIEDLKNENGELLSEDDFLSMKRNFRPALNWREQDLQQHTFELIKTQKNLKNIEIFEMD